MSKDESRSVDESFVIVESDEVEIKAQPSTGRKEVWMYTAVVLVGVLRYMFAEVTAEGLWLQVSALLLRLGVLSGEEVGGAGRQCCMDSSMVRESGDFPLRDDLVLVAPSETML